MSDELYHQAILELAKQARQAEPPRGAAGERHASTTRCAAIA